MFLISLPEEVLLTGDKLLLENLYASMLALGGRLTYNAPYTKKKSHPDAAALTHILTQVHKATGLSLEEIVLQKRAAKWVYARLLLAALASQEGFSVEQIANVLQRSAPSVYRLLQQYRNEVKYNPEFKKMISVISG